VDSSGSRYGLVAGLCEQGSTKGGRSLKRTLVNRARYIRLYNCLIKYQVY
jgi:hypothetical protein